MYEGSRPALFAGSEGSALNPNLLDPKSSL